MELLLGVKNVLSISGENGVVAAVAGMWYDLTVKNGCICRIFITSWLLNTTDGNKISNINNLYYYK